MIDKEVNLECVLPVFFCIPLAVLPQSTDQPIVEHPVHALGRKIVV